MGILVERLEYGKFTQELENESNEDDQVMEHQILAETPGIPAGLREMLDPEVIGRTRPEDNWAPSTPYGILIQTLRNGGLLWQVACRAAQLQEGRNNRVYRRASYLVSRELLSPLQWARLFDQSPFGVFRKSEVAGVQPMEAVAVAVEPEVPDGFLRDAIIYIASGVPVSLLDTLTEVEFLQRAEAVWRMTPQKVWPFLSLAWECGNGVSQACAITAGSGQGEWQAAYHHQVADIDWKAPELRKGARAPFNPALLEAGRTYLGAVEGGGGRLTAVNRLLAVRLPGEQVFRTTDPEFDEAWSSVAQAALDLGRIDRFEKALEGGPARMMDARNLLRETRGEEGLRQIGHRIMAKLRDSRAIDSAGEIFLDYATRDRRLCEEVMAGEASEGARVGRLMLRLIDSAPEAFLDFCASNSGELNEVPDLFVRLMVERLVPAMGSPGLRKSYRKLLEMKAPPGAFRILLNRAGLRVAGLLAEEDSKDLPMLVAQIGKWVETPAERLALAYFYRLVLGQSPDDGRTPQPALGPKSLGPFREILLTRIQKLSNYPAAEQDNLAKWLHVRADEEYLFRDERFPYTMTMPAGLEPSQANVDFIRREIEKRWVPPSAFCEVARLTKPKFPQLVESVLADREGWEPVVRHWPAECAYILGYPFGDWSVAVDEQLDLLPNATVELVLCYWLLSPEKELEQALAASLLDRAKRGPEPADSDLLLRLIRCLWHSFIVFWIDLVEPRLSIGEIQGIKRLAAAVPDRAPWVGIEPRDLARVARQDSQILLLLALAPDGLEFPDEGQLWELRSRPEMLESLVSGKDDRWRQRFRPVFADFHELDYERDCPRYLRSGKFSTPLWAVYRKVPENRQGPLGPALEAFRHSELGRVGLCLRYVKSAEWGDSAAEKVYAQYLLPLWQAKGFSPYDLAELMGRAGLQISRGIPVCGITSDGEIARRENSGYSVHRRFLELLQSVAGRGVSGFNRNGRRVP